MLSIVFLLFLSAVEPARSESTDLGSEKSNPPIFDLDKTLRNSPSVTASLQISWQHFRTGVDAYRLEGVAAFYKIFRAGVDVTRPFNDGYGKETFNTFGSLRGYIYIPLEKLSLSSGLGWTWYQGRENHSGPGTYLSVGYTPFSFLKFDISSQSSLISNILGSAIDIGLSIRLMQIGIRSGYRWLDIAGDTISGPNIGLRVPF